MQDKIKHHKFPITVKWTPWYPRLMTRHTNKLSSKNLLTVLFFFFMLNTMGQDCKDEKLSQQLPHKG